LPVVTTAALISLLAGLANLVIATVVVASSPRQSLHRACAAWGFSVATWNIGVFALTVVESEAIADICARITWMGVAFLPVSVIHFIERSFEHRSRRFGAWYAASAAVALGVWTPFFIRGVRVINDAWYALPGPGLWLFIGLAMPFCYIASMRLLWRKTRDPEAHLSRRAWLLLGVLLACQVLGANDILPVLGFARYPFTEVAVPLLGGWAAVVYAVVVGYGIFSDQLIEMRISLGRALANLLRWGLLVTLCSLLLLLINVVAPEHLTLHGALWALGALVLAATLAGVFSPRLIAQPAERLRNRVYGDRFDYLEKIRVLPEHLYRQSDSARGYARICDGLRDILRLGAVSLWYRDPLGRPRLVPAPSVPLLPAEQDAGWAEVEREARTWLDREDLWVIALRTANEAPSGYLRLAARPGKILQLNELDREAIAELVATLTHQVERESIHASLQLRQANDAKDRFLASINHEVRNPLNGLVGMLDLLRGEALSPEAARRMEVMRACADQLTAVMDNALDFASLAEGRLPVRAIPFELVALLRGSAAHLSLGAAGRIFWELPEGPVWLIADAGKLRQIVSNYVANALKYGQPPHATVRAAVKARRGGGARLQIEVRNPAPPEPGENLDQWFEPFNRGARARSTGLAGTGLGLAISRRLAEAMDGVIGARREGGELVFQLSCPVGLADPAPAAAPGGARFGTAGKTSPLALVIEDEAYNREVIVHHLASWGFRINQAASGAEVREQFARELPDLIITDWLLGDTDGASLLPELLAGAARRRPPVIVLSAYATEEKARQAELAGADRFLTKPLQAPLLHQTIVELLPGLGALSELASSTEARAPGIPGPPSEGELVDRLRALWREALGLLGTDRDAAGRRVHTMRGLARLLPVSELPEALADYERALADGEDDAITSAARAGVEALLASLPTSPPDGHLADPIRFLTKP
jgi:signal transduction histidine kinase/CheY-like chemotaxis protein